MPPKITHDVWELRKSDYGFGNPTHHVSYFTDKAKAERYAQTWEVNHRYSPYWEYLKKTIEIR